MSYKKFVTDLNKFYEDSKNNGTHYEVGQTVIRDHWIKSGRYDELIDFIIENWDSGNCDDFIEPLEKKLITESHINRFERLWRRIIYFRLIKLLDTLKDYLETFKKVDVTSIGKIDVSGFNISSKDSYGDIKNVFAFRRDFLLKGIRKYKDGLVMLNTDKGLTDLSELEIGVISLDKTKMRSKNWR